MRVLITGAAGFIGFHLAKMLLKEEGNTVVGVDNFYRPSLARVNCLRGDIRDAGMMDQLIKNSDIVYHLAAQTNVGVSHKEPQLTFDVNVSGTKNILKSCLKHHKRMIFASSCEVYGSAQGDAISEDHPQKPHSPYAKSKLEAEKLCLDYFTRGLEVSILRSFNTYGPFKEGAVIPMLVEKIYNGQRPEISGDGHQTRDYMYIDDALQAYKLMTRSNLYGKPVNFGTGVDTSVNELVKKILVLMKSDLKPIHIKARINEVTKFKADTTLAEKMGFKAIISLGEGLKRYIKWFKAERYD